MILLYFQFCFTTATSVIYRPIFSTSDFMISQFYFTKIGYAMTTVFKCYRFQNFSFVYNEMVMLNRIQMVKLCYKQQAYNKLMAKILCFGWSKGFKTCFKNSGQPLWQPQIMLNNETCTQLLHLIKIMSYKNHMTQRINN